MKEERVVDWPKQDRPRCRSVRAVVLRHATNYHADDDGQRESAGAHDCTVDGCGRAAAAGRSYCEHCEDELESLRRAAAWRDLRDQGYWGRARRAASRLYGAALIPAAVLLIGWVLSQFLPWLAELVRMVAALASGGAR